MQRLHDIFASQDIEQRWRCANSDIGVRQYFVSTGLISSVEEARPRVFAAMGSFLKDVVRIETVPITYAVRATRIRQHLDQHHPGLRK